MREQSGLFFGSLPPRFSLLPFLLHSLCAKALCKSHFPLPAAGNLSAFFTLIRNFLIKHSPGFQNCLLHALPQALLRPGLLGLLLWGSVQGYSPEPHFSPQPKMFPILPFLLLLPLFFILLPSLSFPISCPPLLPPTCSSTQPLLFPSNPTWLVTRQFSSLAPPTPVLPGAQVFRSCTFYSHALRDLTQHLSQSPPIPHPPLSSSRYHFTKSSGPPSSLLFVLSLEPKLWSLQE